MNPRELQQIGPYPVVEFVAEGGMAWVFKVMDTRFRVHRALKMLKPQAAQGDEFRRFESEAKLLARIEHPNLITIYDLGKDEATGCHYYTMTFVDGPSLAAAERFSVSEAVGILLEVLAALGKLHEAGIIHRDIKPANILRTSDGRILLSDLGIARQQDQLISLTRTGMAIGSIQYMSPEQARGHPVTPSSDVFSLGLALYQMITGHTIYDVVDEVDATSGEQVLMYLGALIHSGNELEFDFPPETPRPIRRVIETACHFDPSARYADAKAMRDALLAAVAEIEPTATPQSAPPQRVHWGLPAAAATLALALVVWWLVPSGETIHKLPPAYQEMLSQLQDPATGEASKRALVAELGVDPNPYAASVLMSAADDASVKVAVDAIKQLNKRVGPLVSARLIELLRDEEYTVRAWAARGLGEAKWAPALPALQEQLERETVDATRRQIQRAIDAITAAEAGAGE
jgi:serine/threonine protein kinase